MRTSRRSFIRTSLATAAGVSLLKPASRAETLMDSFPEDGSRRLFFDESDIPRIRTTLASPRFKSFWETFTEADLEGDMRFLKDEVKLNNHVHHLLRARQVLERSSFVYALTRDRRHLGAAKAAIDRILQFRRWDLFLEGGRETIGLQRAPETTIAMACAVDWLGDALSADTLREMERQIAEKGAPACYRTLYGMKYPERVRGWSFDPESDYQFRFDLSRWPIILNSTNLKVIPIAGLGIAGCLLYRRHPQASRWVDLALQSATAFAVMYGPDGSYDEGVGYWGYTSLHLAIFLEALQRSLGRDHHALINFPGTVRHALCMAMPTAGRPRDCVNFGDAWSMGDVSVAAWTARNERDRLAQYVAASVGEIQSHFAAIWYDPALEPEKPGANLLNVRFSNDWVIARSGWDVSSSVVALRSGGPANHEHADRNSVIFKAYGERLLHDPYKAAYSPTLPQWLLRQTEAHTAVLIDGKGHQYHDGSEGTNASWAEARIVRYDSADGHVVATSDASEAYALVNSDVDLVQRTIIYLKPDVLILLDRVRVKEDRSTVQIRFQIDNSDGNGKATLVPNGFAVERPNATMRAHTVCLGPFTTRVGMLDLPPEAGVHPYVELESVSAREHTILTLCTAQEMGKGHGGFVITTHGYPWKIAGEHNGRQSVVEIRLADDIPAVTVR